MYFFAICISFTVTVLGNILQRAVSPVNSLNFTKIAMEGLGQEGAIAVG